MVLQGQMFVPSVDFAVGYLKKNRLSQIEIDNLSPHAEQSNRTQVAEVRGMSDDLYANLLRSQPFSSISLCYF